MEARSRLAHPGLIPPPHSLPDPVSSPTLGAPMSQKGQPGGPAAAQQARKDSWARLQRGSLLGQGSGGAGRTDLGHPSSPSSLQPFQGAQRDTPPLAGPQRGARRSRASLCCFKAGPWRRDQVSNGETGQVAIAQSSREPWTQLCCARGVRGQGHECVCRYSHRVGALGSCVALCD